MSIWNQSKDIAIQSVPNSTQNRSPARYFSQKIQYSTGQPIYKKQSPQKTKNQIQNIQKGFNICESFHYANLQIAFKRLKQNRGIKRIIGSILHTNVKKNKAETSLFQSMLKMSNNSSKKNLSQINQQKSLIVNKLILAIPTSNLQQKSPQVDHSLFFKTFSITNSQKKY